MKIENIKKLNSGKYKIELDDKNKIITYDDVILKHNLLYHKEVDTDKLNELNIDTKYYDVYNKLHQETFEGFESTVLSHEYDHLNGILHMDIAEEVKILPREERKKWRQSHGYKIINNDGDYENLINKKVK